MGCNKAEVYLHKGHSGAVTADTKAHGCLAYLFVFRQQKTTQEKIFCKRPGKRLPVSGVPDKIVLVYMS